jgi:hypothetical protein
MVGVTLSRRAYARHRGCSEKAVRKALQAERIGLEPDGQIDPTKADALWPIERETAEVPDTPESLMLQPVARTAVASVYETLAEAGEPIGQADDDGSDGLDGAGVTLTDARKAKTIQEAHLRRLQVQRLRGELINRKQAESVVYGWARQERDAWLSWPARVAPQLAADLQVDHRTVHVILEQYVHQHLEELGEATAPALA